MRKRTVITEDVEGIEVELDFEPVSNIFSKKIGNKIVVAYLVHDSDPENPMTSMDGEGRLFTKPERYGGGSITDDSNWHYPLGLTEDGEPDLELEAVTERAAEKLKAILVSDFTASMIRITMEADVRADEALQAVVNEWSDAWGWNTGWDWNEDDRAMLDALPSYQATCEAAWNELNAEGKIGDYLAVPVSWCSSCHGPGTASASVADLDNCNAVWVPGPNEIDNMTFLPDGVDWIGSPSPGFPNRMNVLFKGEVVATFDNYSEAFQFIRETYTDPITHADKLRTAKKYAEGCLNTYEMWCNGEVYGCVVQTHDAETGAQIEQESCWGFYGSDDAEETLLNEFFNPTVEGIENELAKEEA